jgi:predicted nucleic acid binding AN1-type Zn finger protein
MMQAMRQRCTLIGIDEHGRHVHITPGRENRSKTIEIPTATGKCPHCKAPLCDDHNIPLVHANCYKLLHSKIRG